MEDNDEASVPVEAKDQGQNRRRFLAGLGGGLAALGLRGLAGTPARAADGQALILGGNNSATNTTLLQTASGLQVDSADFGGSAVVGTNTRGFGVSGYGDVGVLGEAFAGTPTSIGVKGTSASVENGTGVYGQATGSQGRGVNGTSFGDTGTGVYGQATGSHGRGVSGETTDTFTETYGVLGVVQGSLGRAVFGYSQNSSAGGTGVWGQSNSSDGVGVRGYAWDSDAATGKFGTGVMGTSGSHAFPPPAAKADTGVYGVSVAPSGGGATGGVVGDSDTNPGVVGLTSAPSRAAGQFIHTAGGLGLNVQGFLGLTTAGRATVPAGKTNVTVTMGGVVPTDTVLATVQGAGGFSVKNVTPGTGKFTIAINKAPLSPVSVGYLVLRT